MTKTHELTSDPQRLRVFGVCTVLGDAPILNRFLHRSYGNQNGLMKRLGRLGVRLDSKPFNTIVDQGTHLVVDQVRLVNAQNKWVGNLDLVTATRHQYQELRKSAGHFDRPTRQKSGVLDSFRLVGTPQRKRLLDK